MKRKFYKTISLVLIMTVLAVLTACGQTQNSGDEASQGMVSASQSTAPTAAPVVQLDVFSASTASTTSAGNYDNTWWGKILKEKVGVSLNILPSGDQAQEKLQALMAGGELPDIVVFGTNTKDVLSAIRGNMLVNLDEHMDKLPNVTMNAPKALQYYRDNVSNGTGKVYAIPNAIGPADLFGSEPSWGPYLRWDIYKQIGSPVINTMDDYLTVLKKMQELVPQTKEGKKTYGITLWKDWDGYSMFMATELGPVIGIDCGDQLGALPFLQVDFKNGNAVNTLDADSQYIQALKFYFKANQMGLVDPDSLTQNYSTAKSKITEGRVFFSWWSWLNDAYNTSENVNADSPTGFAAVLPQNTKTLVPSDNNIGKVTPIGIGSKTKNLDAALKFIDFMYSTDGLQLLFNGPEGVTWEMDSSGKPSITEEGWKYISNPEAELPEGGVFTDGIKIGTYGLSTAFINPKTQEAIDYRYWPSTKKHNAENQSKLQKDWATTTGYQTTLDYVRGKDMVLQIPLAQVLTTPMTDEIGSLASRIGDIVKSYSWKMVFAKNEAEFDSIYKEMRTKAEGLGLQKVYDWSLENWNQAQAKAAKYQTWF
jgi:putative aldouronate transport system substrate-binding protein